MDIKLILKGFIVGLGKIIPGVSGSMLAMTLGIYENVIEAVTNFFSNPKKHLKLLMNFGIGVFLAIIIFSKIILFLLTNYYNETMYLFLGLILGTLIPFSKNLKINIKNILIFIIFISLMFLVTYLDTSTKFIFSGSIFNYLYVIFLGIIDAFTSIVPGISGTAIFMILGVYEFVLNILGSPFSLLFIFYLFGMVFGIIVICYIMNYLLKNKKEETYSIIFAFMIGSILILFLDLIQSFNFYLLLIFIIGILFGFYFDK